MEATLTEYEESLSFDLDDPDFAPKCSRNSTHGVFRGVSFGGGMSINVKKCQLRSSRLVNWRSYNSSPPKFNDVLDISHIGESWINQSVRTTYSPQCNNKLKDSKMSATSVQTNSESLSRTNSNVSLSCHSLCGSDTESTLGSHPQYQDTILTIEELRAQLNSCFTCGVSWIEEHVSLDCSECGGYSLKRPCPECNGQCNVDWKRDLTMSHASGKAKWTGECGLKRGPTLDDTLCPSMEKLRATS